MKILYIAVHHHVGWGAEHWLANAFERHGCDVIRYDYRSLRKKRYPWWLIRKQLEKVRDQQKPDIVLLQRCEKMPASVVSGFTCPCVFWSTEPLIRRRDVDALLAAKNMFSWVYLHTYTCQNIINNEFTHLSAISSVLHNAAALENSPGNQPRSRLAIFNRSVSQRRQQWLDPIADLVEVISGHYGEQYFLDLQQSQISINIHYAQQSVDDFETGIFEALASGCAVITESLNPKTVADMGMQDALLQVANPQELRTAIIQLRDNPDLLFRYQQAGIRALLNNRWDSRAEQLLEKFREFNNDKNTVAG